MICVGLFAHRWHGGLSSVALTGLVESRDFWSTPVSLPVTRYIFGLEPSSVSLKGFG